MVNTPGVTLMNITVIGDLIIGDGVGDGEAALENVKLTAGWSSAETAKILLSL